MKTKTCKRCGEAKCLSLFYTHNKMKDGHLNICKDCTKKRVTKHRNKNIDRIREYDRSRGNRQTAEYRKEYRAKNPNKYKAHNSVNNAIRDGKINKVEFCPCGNPSEHAHHDDYNKPLDIRWLCAVCHNKWHKENGEGLNAK